MLQDLYLILLCMELNFTLAIVFIVLSAWTAMQRLRNRKYSTLFIVILLTNAITLCTITFSNYALPEMTLLQQGEQSDYLSNNIAVVFSLQQGATQLILDTIQKAEKSIFVAAYSFTSKPIANALINAYQNGLDVRIVLNYVASISSYGYASAN